MLIVGNWKMHGTTQQVGQLARALKSYCSKDVVVAVMPPHVYLSQIANELHGSTVTWGAQDVSFEDDGAFTGEISATMLMDQGCQYVIVGHSERRQYHQETNEIVAKKFVKAMQHQLTPILCVGETLAQREAQQTEAVVLAQLGAALSARRETGSTQAFVVAYEPIWAIGTGKSASPAEAQAVHQKIRQHLSDYDATLANTTKILYGGSVKVDNASGLFSQSEIDGALVGGASLVAGDFLAIAQAAQASVVATT